MNAPQAGNADIIGYVQGINQNLGSLANSFKTAFPLNSARNTFTMAAAATITVTDASCKATSTVILQPTNAAAGTLQGSAKCLYTTPASGSFTASTASAASAAGTETFAYLILNSG